MRNLPDLLGLIEDIYVFMDGLEDELHLDLSGMRKDLDAIKKKITEKNTKKE